MSVPSWKRKMSTVEYLHKSFELAKTIGQIVNNKPKKYKANYGDKLIKDSLDILTHCQIANSIYIAKDAPQINIELRREHLMEARGLAENLATTAYLFLELVKSCDGVDIDQLYRQEERIGEATSEVVKLISGVLKSDSERIK